jgi:hypothetical protein
MTEVGLEYRGTEMNNFVKREDIPKKHKVISGYESSIAEDFENEKILVAPEFQLPIDYEFLSQLTPKNIKSRKTKKGKVRAFLDHNLDDQEHIIWNFVDDLDSAHYFQTQIHNAQKFIYDYVNTVFPTYKLGGDGTTWRFLPTRDENMHFDIYGHPKTFHIRIFVNLDKEPRIWRSSYNLSEAFDVAVKNYGLEPLQRCGNHKVVNKWLNKNLFGKGDAEKKFPYNEYHFPYGCMWMAYSQNVSHQIVYGNKMIAFTFGISSDGMINSNLEHETYVNNLFTKYKQG